MACAGVEFGGFDVPDILERTLDVITRAGCGQLSVDALHLVRSGVSLTQLAAIDPALIGYVQLCDGPARVESARNYALEGAWDRLAPGEGEFPLIALLRTLPEDLPLCLEVPSRRLQNAGLSAKDRVAAVVSATRSLLAQSGPVAHQLP